MFNKYYKFTYHGFKTEIDNSHPEFVTSEHRYAFTNSDTKKRYIVDINEFDFNIAIVKFCLKNHLESDRRYKIITNDGYSISTLSTVVQIMIDYLKIRPFSSFLIKGVPLESEKDETFTKRFRVYKKVIHYAFAPTDFRGYQFGDKSYYLMLNRKTPSEENVIDFCNDLVKFIEE